GIKRVLWVSSVAVTTLAVAGYVFNEPFVRESGFIDSLSPVENSVIGTRPDADISAIKKLTAEDTLKTLLAEFNAFDCNTLQLKLGPKKHFSISGTVLPTDETRLKTVLDAQLSGFKYSSTANALDKPFCDVLSLLSAGVERNQSTGGELDIQPYSHLTTYVEDELIKFEMIAPADNVFIYVDYFNADGSVVHLYPANDIENKVIQGPASLLIGDDAWEVSAPFGTDMISVIAYPEALFEPLRPSWEQNAEEYLKALNKVLNALDRQQLVKADYFFLTTKPK
ncbi:MAG: hypothetical protein KAJ63_08495, partial [Methyloprofundus sp.]|nr:hypothetical protein [Methyloprofundus sp.]